MEVSGGALRSCERHQRCRPRHADGYAHLSEAIPRKRGCAAAIAAIRWNATPDEVKKKVMSQIVAALRGEAAAVAQGGRRQLASEGITCERLKPHCGAVLRASE